VAFPIAVVTYAITLVCVSVVCAGMWILFVGEGCGNCAFYLHTDAGVRFPSSSTLLCGTRLSCPLALDPQFRPSPLRISCPRPFLMLLRHWSSLESARQKDVLALMARLKGERPSVCHYAKSPGGGGTLDRRRLNALQQTVCVPLEDVRKYFAWSAGV
jgi:hypothetical protein